MQAIQTTLAADSDYHILVADTDAWGRCNTINGWNGNDPGSDTCNNYIKNTPFIQCDRGARSRASMHPAGQSRLQHARALTHGRHALHRAGGSPTCAGTFACMATVGVAGHPSERPDGRNDRRVAARRSTDAGGCNQGFLRDDALLVITFMSDDPNYEDANGPDQWYDAVRRPRRAATPARSVVLGPDARLGRLPGRQGPAQGQPLVGVHRPVGRQRLARRRVRHGARVTFRFSKWPSRPSTRPATTTTRRGSA